MSICHCLSVKKKVSVKNVKILEMSDFGNSDFPPPRHSIMGRKPPLNANKQRKKKVSFFIALLAVIMLTAFYL